MNKLLLLQFTITIISCSPKFGSKITNAQPKFDSNENVVISTVGDYQEIKGILVGEISSSDNGLSTNCSYPQIIENLKNIARENGANIIEINSHKTADKWSTCDRIKAHIYRVTDAKKYESTIEWSKDRKLTWDDFKGDVPENKINTRFAAETASELKFQTNTALTAKAIKYFVNNTFDCYKSWVKDEGRNDYVLNHEQRHFDLSEIYKRKLLKELNNSTNNRSNFNSNTETIFYRIHGELNEKQQDYDRQTEHGINEEKQKEWNGYIDLQLETSNSF